MNPRARSADPSQGLGGHWLLGLGVPVAVIAVFTSNPVLTVASLALLFALVKFFWRPGEPPILLYALGYQWLQANILIFFSDLKFQPLSAADESLYIVEATWLTLAGLLAVALGIRAGAGKPTGPGHRARLAELANGLSVPRLFLVCLAAILLSNIMSAFAFAFGGLAQPILALANFHWAIVYLLAYTVLTQNRGHRQLLLVFALELTLGFLGFFSEFKTVLIIVLLAALAIPGALKGTRGLMAGALVAFTIALGVVWTGVKTDYRAFLNQGSGEQIVAVPVGDRLEKLAELVSDLDGEKLVNSTEKLMRRLTYVHYLGESIRTVPSHIPHENGKLWWEAVQNAAVPRFINPSKAILDDTLRTMYYTGEWIIGADLGTSVSLGYVAESYIDFGPVLMMIPLFLWGLLVGWAYRFLVVRSRHPFFGYACATVPIFFNASLLELSNAKMLAGLILGTLVLYLVQRQYATRLLRLMVEPRSFDRPHPAGSPGLSQPVPRA